MLHEFTIRRGSGTMRVLIPSDAIRRRLHICMQSEISLIHADTQSVPFVSLNAHHGWTRAIKSFGSTYAGIPLPFPQRNLRIPDTCFKASLPQAVLSERLLNVSCLPTSFPIA